MIVDGEDLATGFSSAFGKGFNVNWLDWEEINDSDVNAFFCEFFAGGNSLMKIDSRSDDGQDVLIGLLDDFRFANLEFVIIVMDNLEEKIISIS